jgi:hypothetical protein
MSDFVKYDLGFLDAGSVVGVEVDTRVMVRLVDQANFQAYRSGRQYRFFGGEAIRSPIPIEVPSSGHWYVVIDFNGGSGNVRSSVNVLSPA